MNHNDDLALHGRLTCSDFNRSRGRLSNFKLGRPGCPCVARARVEGNFNLLI